MSTVRLTVAQALVRFLAGQRTERDGVEQRLIPGCFGIFGPGNVAGVGQALLEAHATGSADLRYYLARNEQAMVHASVGFARMRNRLQAFACTASIGPGSTNMVTGAALATINRIPVLLLPSDFFATRAASPLLQELEDPRSYDVSVNDAFKPVSRFWDRISRPEQLPSALLAAMRVLTDPAETGAVTLALPQDVQAEAHDWPDNLFTERTWFVPRPLPEPSALGRAVEVLRHARRPLVIAGGGVIYSEAGAALRRFAEATGIGVSDTQAGKGALAWDHPCAVGGVGATGSPVANALAREADVVFGIGTRYSDFTTASRTAFQHPDMKFVNLNVAAFDAGKHAGASLVADARAGLEALTTALTGYHVDPGYTARIDSANADWRQAVEHAYHLGHQPLPAQTEILGALNEFMDERDVVVQAAGSMPGDFRVSITDPAGKDASPIASFTWLAEEQTYQCPEEQRLELATTQTQQRADHTITLTLYTCPPEYCQACPRQPVCTRTPQNGGSGIFGASPTTALRSANTGPVSSSTAAAFAYSLTVFPSVSRAERCPSSAIRSSMMCRPAKASSA